MLYILQTTFELGVQYALIPLALFLSFRVLDIADLTTDGSFVLGMAVSVTLAAAGQGHPHTQQSEWNERTARIGSSVDAGRRTPYGLLFAAGLR